MASRSTKQPLKRIDALLGDAYARAPVLMPWTIGLAFLGLGYWYIFSTEDREARWPIFETMLINIGTAWVVGLLAAAVLRRLVPALGPSLLLLTHIVAASLFSLGWYLLNITTQGWAAGSLVDGALIRPFRGPAFLWQIFQGFAVYGALAGLVHVALKRVPDGKANGRLPERMLLRTGDEMVTIEPADIVAIIAADDYSEVRTRHGDHLVRKRLGEFEEELPASFVRVHRSAIVNLDRVVRAEPAGGGRITIHLEGSDPVIASRSGAKLLRQRTL